MPDILIHTTLLLFAAAFFAGFVDSIAGGGGLITIPAMLVAGIPPLLTLGTNKLQSQFGSLSATIAYARRGHVDLRSQIPMAAMATVGGALGAVLATMVPADMLKLLMPFCWWRSPSISPSSRTSTTSTAVVVFPLCCSVSPSCL